MGLTAALPSGLARDFEGLSRLSAEERQKNDGKHRLNGGAARGFLVPGFLALCLAAVVPAPGFAQSWWPFGGDEKKPVPREPVYREPQAVPAPVPGGAEPPAQQPGPQAAPGGNWMSRNPICLQLEQRLVQEGQKGSQSRDQLARVEQEQRQVDRAFNAGNSQLERSCYEVFLFTKSFRNTPQCKELARQVEVSKRRLSDLEAQRQQLSSGRNFEDDIIRELARNRCGPTYTDQARRREGAHDGMWNEEGEISGGGWTPHGGAPGETYRTVCVRLCDGYYFPISFSTLRSHFAQDAEACTSKCSAPVELYYHPNPGGTMEQAVALQSSEPYTKLKTAFRYRKEYVNGCSCKEAEYLPAAADQKADAPVGHSNTHAASGAAAGADVTTGSTTGTGTSIDGWQTEASPQPE